MLPDGSTASASPVRARELADALWEVSLEPGAAMAAARIAEALRESEVMRRPVEFHEREVEPLLRIAGESLNWNRGTETPPSRVDRDT